MSWMPPSSSTATTVVVIAGHELAEDPEDDRDRDREEREQRRRRSRRSVAICSGTFENEAIASSAKRTILRIGYFVLPAWRAARS